MFERILTILGTVAITLTQDDSMNQDNETYKTLKKIFREINFSELVQEWATTYLQDGEKEEELKPLSVEQRKDHFINFMITKYAGLINPTIRRKITQEADEYERNKVFEQLYFGGKRGKIKRTRKRRTIRRRKTRKIKRSIKSQKIKKIPKIRRPRKSYKK
jgi:hypothetical protein